MAYFEITNEDWLNFENEFTNVTRNDVIEVSNIFRHPCRIFIQRTLISQWNNVDFETSYYHVTKNNNICLWVKNIR
jgi:hypothetical protein